VADTDPDLPPASQLCRTAREIPVLAACDAEVARAELFATRREPLVGAGVEVIGCPSRGAGKGIELRSLLTALYADRGVSTLLVEAGPGILGAMLEQDLIDEAVVYVAPLLLGDELAKAAAVGRVAESLSAGRRYQLWRLRAMDGDVELTYRRREHSGH